MPKFRFLATLTVDAPSEAAAQTQADHAIEDADQYLSEDYKLEIVLNEDGPNTLPSLNDLELPRYTVELTTEGWQIKDSVRGIYGANTYGHKDDAQEMADICNQVDAAEGQGRR